MVIFFNFDWEGCEGASRTGDYGTGGTGETGETSGSASRTGDYGTGEAVSRKGRNKGNLRCSYSVPIVLVYL